MEGPPPFVIGHHDSKRPLPVTADNIRDAHAANVSPRQTEIRFEFTSNLLIV
jgi:hypothetical protein